MLGVLFIAAAWPTGFYLVKRLLPVLFRMDEVKSIFGKQTELTGWMITLPASFFTGTLALTWVTYLAAYLFRGTGRPMLAGNCISLAICAVLALRLVIKGLRKPGSPVSRTLDGGPDSPVIAKTGRIRLSSIFKKAGVLDYRRFLRENRLELIFILAVTAIFSYLIFRSFQIIGGTMYIGYSVYSDFGPHLAMIRSFSEGSNFPTEYPHFADGTVRYHFLFQFLAGNLEYLGMRLDWAFNLPSILSMVLFLMLLYSFAVIITGKREVGFLTGILFIFRSSFAFFTFISDKASIGEAVSLLIKSDVHIGRTPYEDWGLWAQKTFINQRHFAFGLGIMLIALIALYPTLKEMVVALKSVHSRYKEKTRKTGVFDPELPEGHGEKAGDRLKAERVYRRKWLREYLLRKNAWLPESMARPAALGIILGLSVFWNGAVAIAALSVLFIMALFSKHRLEYLIAAVITLVLSLLETSFFFGTGAPTVEPRLTIGFIAPEPGVAGIIAYYTELLGIMPFAAAAGLAVLPKGSRWLASAFLAPLIFATTVQLTPDIAVNHKYVLVSVLLLNIFAAAFICRLFSGRRAVMSAVAALLVIAMTITGVADFMTLNNIDKNRGTIRTDDPVKDWVLDNTGPNEIFLTDIYVSSPILLAGRKLFYGWPYFAWSAGYNTRGREDIQRRIYGGTDAAALKQLVKENNISYIAVDDGNRDSKDYELNEELISETFRLVFSNGEGNIKIYRTH